MNRPILSIVLATACSLSFTVSVVPAADFLALDHPDFDREYAMSVSADGAVVVGQLSNAERRVGYRWSRNDGFYTLEFLDESVSSDAWAVSADGSRVVGETSVGSGVNRSGEAYYWDVDGGFVSLGTLPGSLRSAANDISADGKTIIGSSFDGLTPSSQARRRAFRWTEDTGMVDLLESQPLEGANNASASSISADGSVIVGRAGSSPLVHWMLDSSSGELVDLGPNGGVPEISANGDVVVGYTSGGNFAPNRWTAETGWQVLDDREGPYNQRGITADGAIVAYKQKNDSLIWHESVGSLDFVELLKTEHGLADELASWRESSFLIRAMSGDGSTIVGHGMKGRQSTAFVAQLDRPIHWMLGDANLDFEVDFDDFVRLSDSFGRAGSWENGDFDLNGRVEFSDFVALSNRFGESAKNVTSVPEPSGVAPLVVMLFSGIIACLRSRRGNDQR